LDQDGCETTYEDLKLEMALNPNIRILLISDVFDKVARLPMRI